MTSKRLKIPSAQHLARNYRATSQEIAVELVRLFENTPTFNYNAVYSAINDMLILGVPFADIRKGIVQKVKRIDVRKNFLEILSLAHKHFENESPDFVNAVSARSYPLARGMNGELLSIPFTPPMIYGVGGQLVFPWFVFWKDNPIAGEKLQLFVTIVKEILAQDPDLEDARFEIHDYSAPKSKQDRILTITNAADVPILSDKRRDEMLMEFADGFFLAQEMISGKRAERQENAEAGENQTENSDSQPDLPLW